MKRIYPGHSGYPQGKGVRAVFFVTMHYAKSAPELVRRMIDEGHIVGNHSTNHPNYTAISLEKATEETFLLHDYVKENFGYDMYLFRPPEGAFSEQSLSLLQAFGYRTVLWSFA
jgi:peptidoglycan-N-acetylmuramic acid deacetylase